MNKQPEITDKTRQNFVDVFTRLYLEKDISKITVREIAEKSKSSRATFYRYFRDIYAIFEYIEEFVFKQIGNKLSDSINLNATVDDFVDNVSEIYEKWQLYLRVLFKENGLDSFRKRLIIMGKEQIIQNLHLSDHDIRTDYILDYYMTSVVTIIGQWMNHPEELTKEDMVSIIKGILSQSVLEQIAGVSPDLSALQQGDQ